MKESTSILPLLKFRFHLDHPTLEECYTYGYECALANGREEDNPYQLNSTEGEQWLEGWWAGFYQDQPLFAIETDPEEERTGLNAANDAQYCKKHSNYLFRVLEIAGVIAVSAILGYQVMDIVA